MLTISSAKFAAEKTSSVEHFLLDNIQDGMSSFCWALYAEGVSKWTINESWVEKAFNNPFSGEASSASSRRPDKQTFE